MTTHDEICEQGLAEALEAVGLGPLESLQVRTWSPDLEVIEIRLAADYPAKGAVLRRWTEAAHVFRAADATVGKFDGNDTFTRLNVRGVLFEQDLAVLIAPFYDHHEPEAVRVLGERIGRDEPARLVRRLAALEGGA